MRRTSSRGTCSRGESSNNGSSAVTGESALASPRPPVRPRLPVAWMNVRRFMETVVLAVPHSTPRSQLRVLPGVAPRLVDGVFLGVDTQLLGGAGGQVEVQFVGEPDEIEKHVRDLLPYPSAHLGRDGSGLCIRQPLEVLQQLRGLDIE